MEDPAYEFRLLCEELLDGLARRTPGGILSRWRDRNADAAARHLEPHGRPAAAETQSENSYERNTWDLYALSRLSDAVLTFTEGAARSDSRSYDAAGGLLDEYLSFFQACGFTRIPQERFHPFFHEIVDVEQSPDADEPISTVSACWPGMMLGSLLFAREGVRVRGGRKHVRAEVATGSTLYFAYRRARRPTNDLSVGWGHNSQWRTDFRRDYLMPSAYRYNVGGQVRLGCDGRILHMPEGNELDSGLSQELTPAERLELLRHRCLITSEKPDDDLFPFDDAHDEPR